MAPPRRMAAEDKARVFLTCSRQQKAILVSAAERAGCDLNTLILTHALAGAAKASGTAAGESPVIVNGAVGAKLRERSAAQGVAPERLVEMLLIAQGG